MTLAVALFGLFVVTLGAVGIASPERLLALVTRAQSQLGLYFIAGVRLLVGVALLLAAPASRAPLYLQALGVVALISGAVTPFVGVSRFEAILDWWRQRGPGFVRPWSVLVLLFGASLVWAVFPLRLG
jgi:hypothetical protein